MSDLHHHRRIATATAPGKEAGAEDQRCQIQRRRSTATTSNSRAGAAITIRWAHQV
jgi:hypothetical protein